MIKCNPFVYRQTASSEFSHFGGSFEELETLVESIPQSEWVSGYRDGVRLVRVKCAMTFFSPTAELKFGDMIVGRFEPRREGEGPRVHLRVYGEKTPVDDATVVLYSSKVLAESGDNALPVEEGNWEIVSINAGDELPISPNTLMHNHFGSDGGTDTNLPPEEFEKMLRESFLANERRMMVRTADKAVEDISAIVTSFLEAGGCPSTMADELREIAEGLL